MRASHALPGGLVTISGVKCISTRRAVRLQARMKHIYFTFVLGNASERPGSGFSNSVNSRTQNVNTHLLIALRPDSRSSHLAPRLALVSSCDVRVQDVRVSKIDHYYQTLIVPIFLTDPYIVVIAGRGRGEGEGEKLSWSEGEERERGRQVWGGSNKTQKSVEGGSVAEKHATLAVVCCCYALDRTFVDENKYR